MKVKCQMCSPKFLGERQEGKKKKKTHGHVILLDSIKYSNNFVLKKGCNNLFKSNKTTNFNKKNSIFVPKVYLMCAFNPLSFKRALLVP